MVPWIGHAPECDDPKWPEFFTQAPMARYVADLPLALKVLAGDRAAELRLDEKVRSGQHWLGRVRSRHVLNTVDSSGPARTGAYTTQCVPEPRLPPLPCQVELKSVRVLYIESEPSTAVCDPICAEVGACMTRAVQHLRAQGLDVQPLKLAGLEDGFAAASLLMLQLRRVHTVHYDPERPDSLHRAWSELFRFITCRSKSTLHSVVAGVLFYVAHKFTPQSVLRKAEAQRALLLGRLQAVLGQDAVLLYPSMPKPAQRIGLFWSLVLNSSYFMIFNLLGMPVTQVPFGLGTSSGLPVGLQVRVPFPSPPFFRAVVLVCVQCTPRSTLYVLRARATCLERL